MRVALLEIHQYSAMTIKICSAKWLLCQSLHLYIQLWILISVQRCEFSQRSQCFSSSSGYFNLKLSSKNFKLLSETPFSHNCPTQDGTNAFHIHVYESTRSGKQNRSWCQRYAYRWIYRIIDDGQYRHDGSYMDTIFADSRTSHHFGCGGDTLEKRG